MIIQLKTVSAAALLAGLFNATADDAKERTISEYEAKQLLLHRGDRPFVSLEGRKLPLDFSNTETLDTSDYEEEYGAELVQEVYKKVLDQGVSSATTSTTEKMPDSKEEIPPEEGPPTEAASGSVFNQSSTSTNAAETVSQ